MANELAIVRPENIQEIVSGTPGAYNDNSQSMRRCTDCGNDLLARIRQGGMTDELDGESARFVEKARKTLKKMNERRSSVTRLFDSIKTEFTALENAVDPTKKGTPAWEVQQERNRYAALKREEAERRRREEAERQRVERQREEDRANVVKAIRKAMSDKVKHDCDTLQSAFNYTTLDNYEATAKAIGAFSAKLDETAFYGEVYDLTDRYFASLEMKDRAALVDPAMQDLMPDFVSYYAQQTGALKDDLLAKLPSKKAQLQKAAKASEEESERIKRQMEEADRAEAERREKERLEKEEADRRAAELAAKQREADNLFSQAAVQQPAYTPKTKVTKKIELLNPDGIMPILNYWYVREGCRLPVEELAKTFKKQIAFCEKIANCPNPEFIRDESVAYVDEVKAR